jgi:glutaredoxin
MKKDKLILISIIVIIIAIIVIITVLKDNGVVDEETMQCIADNSKLIVSPTCGHCADQKKILGEALNKFELLDVTENPNLWEDYDLIGVPTWIINDKTHPGVKTPKELKKLTGC